MFASLAMALWACASEGIEPFVVATPTESIIAIHGCDDVRVQIQVAVDERPMQEYWQEVFEEIFRFADRNDDAMLDPSELQFVPSARAIRLSLGNGFTPPVAAITSIRQITGSDDVSCTQNALETYYRLHGIGKPQIGWGQLPHSQSLTDALIAHLDSDKDHAISSKELRLADEHLRKFDTNDDEMIGAAELVPTIVYPGAAGTHTLSQQQIEDRTLASSSANEIQWSITIAESISVVVKAPDHSIFSCTELWTVLGPLPQRMVELQSELPSPFSYQPSMRKAPTPIRELVVAILAGSVIWLILTETDSERVKKLSVG